MKILIVENETRDGAIVSCGKKSIEVSKESKDWTNEGINKFLVNIAVSVPDGEKIEISPLNNEIENNVYKFVWELFNEFCIEYNNNIKVE